MNTLKFKALLIKAVCILFIRAIGIYLLITLPAAAAEPMLYLTSALYAISFGLIAAGVFLVCFYALQKMKAGIAVKNILLYAAIAVAVVLAFQMMEITGVEYRIWHSGAFLIFPAMAVVAGWISLALSKSIIKKLFAPAALNYYEPSFNQSITGKSV